MTWAALRRGLSRRCPHCGQGALFSGWSHLDRCSACGLVYERNPGDTWAFWNGQVFRASFAEPSQDRPRAPRAKTTQSLTAPMPATVINVFVQPGAAVKKGDILVILEAMKMELPIHAPADAIVAAVHCRAGDLVQPETTLIDLA